MTTFTAEDAEAALREGFPGDADVEWIVVEALTHERATLRLQFHEGFLRPGGTISGPALMKLADTAMYVALMGAFDGVPLAATTNLSIEFLHRPDATDLVAEARLVRLGRRRATGQISIFNEGRAEPVAIATASYHIANQPEG